MMRLRFPIAVLVVVLVGFLVGGCSKANPEAPALRNGQHPTNWMSTTDDGIIVHGEAFVRHPEQCYSCHGQTLTGGISGVSCGLCHPVPQFPHPEGWESPDQHGESAKQPMGMNFCAGCHGRDFTGRPFGDEFADACSARCHQIPAPHPLAWQEDLSRHTNTDPSNAPNCRCHASTPDQNVALNCFNNTLCHGPMMVHPDGWVDPSVHGAAAIGTPTNWGDTAYPTGLRSCQECHGGGFTGMTGSAGGCNAAGCHALAAPHTMSSEWLGAGELSHRSTNSGNLGICAQCHSNGALSSVKPSTPAAAGTPPGCFNGTLCHDGGSGGGSAPHPVPYLDHSSDSSCTNCHSLSGARLNGPNCDSCHYDTASIGGCTSCHGTPPNASSFPNIEGQHDRHSRYGCITCHDDGGAGTLAHYNGSRSKVPHPAIVSGTKITRWSPSTPGHGSCQPTCHGSENW